MSVLVAVLVVGLGSLALRAAPLLVAAHVPDRVARAAGWAGTSVIAALVVRAVVHHEVENLPAAPLVAAVAVAAGLVVAARGRSVLTALAVGLSVHLALTLALTAGP